MPRFAIQYQWKVASVLSTPAILPLCDQLLFNYSTGRARSEQVRNITVAYPIRAQKHFLPFDVCHGPPCTQMLRTGSCKFGCGKAFQCQWGRKQSFSLNLVVRYSRLK
ncbi:hypothetical protein SS50377_28482 [Spironucleus salmonicida]|uniref:Uncharacterized protein n=1 Tax=Spironucleus salmonicida TaxID=348837 RepID=A0A9P8LJX8_9EUKA|nr:hypothetical protein SS50377_28482 [Spironucleus salmonicida]